MHLMSYTTEGLKISGDKLIFLLKQMEFPVDLKKFLLSPTQSFKFLDLEIDSKKMVLTLQVVKVKKLI